jgi:diguanylate cyclase (GGDEF)-like protein
MARHLRVLVGALVLVLYVVALLATAMGSRRTAEAEMASVAAAAASFLAVQIADLVSRGDRSGVEAALDAALGRDGLQAVSVSTSEGGSWVQRERAARSPNCPGWVATLLPIVPVAQAAEIPGSRAVGRLTVVPDAASAQELVWDAVRAVAGPAALAALALLLAAWGAIGALARPLRALEGHAQAALQWESPPAADGEGEGGPVAEVLTELSRRSRMLLAGVQGLAATLHERAARDPLTGLLTRGWLLDVLEYRRRDPEQTWTGALLLIRVDGIKGVNDTFGYAAGDDVLRESARLLEDTLGRRPEVLIAHLAGGEFAAFVPCAGPAETREHVAALNVVLGDLASRLRFPTSLVAYAGGAYSWGQTVSALFAEADRDLRKTEWRYVPGASVPRKAAPAAERDLAVRRDAALAALRGGGLRLVLQPVVALDSRALLHLEGYSRLCGPDGAELMPIGELLATGSPAVAAELDQAAVAEALRRLGERPDGPDIAVNLAGSSLRAPGMMDWLEAAARAHPADARRLVLELPDPAVQAALPEVSALAARLAPFGVRIAVDHFGTGAASFDYLHRLPLAHLKIDGSFAARLERHADSRFYVRATAQIARGLGIPVTVEAVESEAQLAALDGLGVDGAQGYYLGRPT